ncbi:hypothetical protein [Leptothoe sp. PORK10 BA2]|uniref:hypothetical protein n=1 Tax=Leptothoe sp. PORK10 BA2 TaxID=3110254 RepID=UPI002B21B92E|nr:hypothetical protein [Leptothoe sp. PORK10 BA2]MEA5464311.1 hypothetical protein [Leptothoe sp. PORK10 BA2]
MNPWLWLGILLTGVVGTYAWQYHQSSGQLPWQIGATGLGSSGNDTSTDALLESLTPEEQSIAAELDNIDLLISQLDSDVSVLTTGGEASAAAALNAALSKEPSATSESSVDRLTRYISEYNFVGTNAQGANGQTAKNSTLIPLQRSSESSLTPGARTELQTTSALATAFAARQQQFEQAAGTSSTQGTSRANSSGTPNLSAGAGASDNATSDSAGVRTDGASTFTFDQTGVVPGSVDGLNRTFIRTTPNMSPPPGTTGYVPPASLPDFNRVNQPSSNSPFGNQPAPSSFGSTVPSVNPPNRSQVLPPVGPSVTPPLETPALNGSSQAAPNEPRNAWESFWD